GCENACRAIESREGFVKSSHIPTYSGLLLYQVDLLAGVCDLKCRFDSGYPTPNNEDVRIDCDFLHFERLVEIHSHYGGSHNILSSFRCKNSILGYPGALFSNVGHLE